MRNQSGVSSVEIVMAFVVFSIIAVVALPSINSATNPTSNSNKVESVKKIKSAFAIAIAEQGNYPRLSDVVEYIDADFASETNDLSGIIFRDGETQIIVKTYSDTGCKFVTSNKKPGVTDIVRCI